MPFLKALALASVAFPLASATHLVGATQEGLSPTEHPEVVRVNCMTGSGTAFWTGPHTLLSVHHVTKSPGCFIGQDRFEVKHHKGDFSILRMEAPSKRWLAVDCNGFIPGRRYSAFGYARGLGTITRVDITASSDKFGDMVILKGVFTVLPGQSGGPVVDMKTGKAVGMVNLYAAREGWSASVELKSTAACAR